MNDGGTQLWKAQSNEFNHRTYKLQQPEQHSLFLTDQVNCVVSNNASSQYDVAFH